MRDGHSGSLRELLDKLESDPRRGLKPAEAARRLGRELLAEKEQGSS